MPKDSGYVDGVDLVDGVGPLLARQDRVAELENEIAQLREALTRRQQYGVVTGMLAVRYRISPDRAWQLLVRLSQHSNLKIQVITRILHDRSFGRLAAEDVALATRLDAELPGQLRSLAAPATDGGVHDNQR